MDNYHILDAYRSNKKLLPMGEPAPAAATAAQEEALFERVYKAAYQTKDKYDTLVGRERSRLIALATVQAMAFCMAVFLVGSVVYSDQYVWIKVTYSSIIIFVFAIGMLVMYNVFFSAQMFEATEARMVMEEVYQFRDDTAAKAYRIAQELRDLRTKYREENSTECLAESGDPDVAKKINELKAAVGTTFEDAVVCKTGGLQDAIRVGMLYTVTDDAARTVDGTVGELRALLGSETYRAIEDSDAYDVIDDVVVPRMIAEKERVARTKADVGPAPGPAPSGDGACDQWCDETVERLVADALDPQKSPPTSLLDDAWERCKPDMSAVCSGNRLRTGGQRCAFGCAKAEEATPQVSTVRLDNQVPDDGVWVEQTGLQVAPPASGDLVGAGGEGEGEAEAAPPPAGLETTCMQAAAADEDVDAAYYGQTAPGSADKCFFHYRAGENAAGAGTFTKSTAEPFSGKLLTKAGSNVRVPGASPAEAATAIANEVLGIHSAFDLTPYDVHVYESLRYQDGDFARNRHFYEAVFEHLTQALRPSADSDANVLVPSVQQINQTLSETTARAFRGGLVWNVARASAFLHIRVLRLDQKESYSFLTKVQFLKQGNAIWMTVFGLSVVISVLAYVVFTIEREAARDKDGRLSLYELLFGLRHAHLISAAGLLTFWVIVYSWIKRGHSRALFNEGVRETNTRKFVQAVYSLREFLFALTDTLPDLAGDDDTQAFAEPRLALLAAAHSGDVDVVKPFAAPDELMINALSLESKLRLVSLCQDVVTAYDRCNTFDGGKGVPFPAPEVIVYGTGIVTLAVGMAYTCGRFNVAEVARRVERVRELRPRLYMGDENAAREITGLLECGEDAVADRLELVKNMLAGMVAIAGVMVTVMLINSNREYDSMLHSGFMTGRGRCVL